MNRSLSIFVAFVAAGSLGISLSSCNAPSCGPGTVQQQQKDGTLKCVLADQPQQLTPCDTDGGNVVIVGGKCVSAIQCDPGTTMNENGICVGTGVGGPATCSPPATGKACIQGTIYDFHSNAKATTPIHLELYDPIKLLQGGGPLASTDSTDGFSYKFQDFMPPTLGLVVIVTAGLVPGMTTAGFVPTGSAGQGIGAAKYTIDTYALTTTDAAKWNFDITTGGAFIAKFYSNPAPAAGAPVVVADDKTAVAGVTLLKDGANAGAKYFDATLTAVDPTLTVTGTSGTAIVASPVAMGSNFSQFTGMGPAGMTWETHPGGSAPNLVLILRFHPM